MADGRTLNLFLTGIRHRIGTRDHGRFAKVEGRKNMLASVLGKLGGNSGGRKVARQMSAAQRRERARKGGLARAARLTKEQLSIIGGIGWRCMRANQPPKK